MFFSVIMPVFNAEKTLRRSLDALSRQTFRDFELIAVDDASTDQSYSILCDYQKEARHPCILEKNTVNLGVGATLQKAANLASGDWMARLDSDDAYAHDYLESRYMFILVNKGIYMMHGGKKVIGGSAYLVDASNPIKLIHYTETSQGPTLVIRRDFFHSIGGFSDKRYGEDFELLERVQRSHPHRIHKFNDGRYHYHRDNENSLTHLALRERNARIKASER